MAAAGQPLFAGRVVLRVQIVDIQRSAPVDLHDRLGLAERVVMCLGGQVVETAGLKPWAWPISILSPAPR
ncbi:hypothetical protein AWV80_26665 [Cupriavidus sp. UYMU48A]|nr:hypothetical protein AWV80_26665 [Cupriavidus sp. UYMU48A]